MCTLLKVSFTSATTDHKDFFVNLIPRNTVAFASYEGFTTSSQGEFTGLKPTKWAALQAGKFPDFGSPTEYYVAQERGFNFKKL